METSQTIGVVADFFKNTDAGDNNCAASSCSLFETGCVIPYIGSRLNIDTDGTTITNK